MAGVAWRRAESGESRALSKGIPTGSCGCPVFVPNVGSVVRPSATCPLPSTCRSKAMCCAGKVCVLHVDLGGRTCVLNETVTLLQCFRLKSGCTAPYLIGGKYNRHHFGSHSRRCHPQETWLPTVNCAVQLFRDDRLRSSHCPVLHYDDVAICCLAHAVESSISFGQRKKHCSIVEALESSHMSVDSLSDEETLVGERGYEKGRHFQASG